jgi:hypothetical protein
LEFKDGKKENEQALRKKVGNVFARNMTNISIALEKAISVFRETSLSNRRAFLFSDGQANSVTPSPLPLLLLPLSLY